MVLKMKACKIVGEQTRLGFTDARRVARFRNAGGGGEAGAACGAPCSGVDADGEHNRKRY